MNQPYFIVDLAHSFHGRVRSIHIPHRYLYLVLVFALFGCVSMFGIVTSYLRMAWKVSHYNQLRDEVETLRGRYTVLEREARLKGVQLASLQLLANEVSVAYGIRQEAKPLPVTKVAALMPTMSETLEQYSFLKTANFTRPGRSSSHLFPTNALPAIWPVEGRLMSSFGHRSDPFSGMGAFHAGVDISAPTGMPIKASADGIVESAEWAGDYGRLVVLNHGNGIQTYYAHLSGFEVIAGQYVHRGEVVGRAGSTGRATSSHLHYEVRRSGTPVNPHPYLRNTYAFTPRREYGL